MDEVIDRAPEGLVSSQHCHNARVDNWPQARVSARAASAGGKEAKDSNEGSCDK